MATRAGIKINAAEALGLLRTVRLGVSRRRALLSAIGDRQLKFVADNFRKQGLEQPWAPLKPATLRRRRKGGAGAQILQDRGILRGSFVKKVRTNFVFVGSTLKYAATHEYGDSRRNIPQRKMLPTKSTAQELARSVVEAAFKQITKGLG